MQTDVADIAWWILVGTYIGIVCLRVPLAIWAICVRAAFMFMCLFFRMHGNWMGFYGLCKRILSNLILHIVLSV